MPLLNYTTTVSPEKTASEIIELLRRHKREPRISDLMMNFDLQGRIVGLKFQIQTDSGRLAFDLPARTQSIARIMMNSSDAAERRMGYKDGQPERVAWRILKSWVQAQLALIEVGMADIDEVFSPYLSVNGSTLWKELKAGKLQQLMLPSGE